MKKMKIWLVLVTVIALAAAVAPLAPVYAQNTSPVVAFTGQDGNVYFYHMDGSGLDRITEDGHLRSDPASTELEIEYQSLSWSPDGRKLAAIRQQSEIKPDRMDMSSMVVVYDLQARAWQQIGEEMRSVAWSPDSTGLIYSSPVFKWSGRGQLTPPYTGVYKYDLSNGQVTEILPAKNTSLNFPGFSKTGRYLVAYEVVGMEGLGNFVLYDTQTQNYRVWGPETQFAAASLNWAKDDSFVVFDQNTYSPSADSKIYRAGPSFEDITVISPQVEGRIFFGPRFSPRQDRVVAMSDPNPDTAVGPIYSTIWLFNLDGSNAREILAPQTSIYSYQWAADGRRLIYSSGDYRQETVQILDVDTGKTELLGRGREFAIQPGTLEATTTGPTAAPLPTSTSIPPEDLVQVVTATPLPALQPTPPMPPDRVLPPAPAWVTPRLLAILLCGGSLGVLAVVIVLVLIIRKR